MLGCFNPNLSQIWTYPNVGVKVKVEVGLEFEITLLTQYLGLTIFDPNLG